MTDNLSFLQQRGRHADIISQALEAYDEWMLDDDYNAPQKLHEIMKRMRERFEMSDVPARNPRDALIEECAKAAEAQDREGYEWVKDSLWANILRRAGTNVRRLKTVSDTSQLGKSQ